MPRLIRTAISALVLASTLGLVPAVHADAAERLTPAVPLQTQREQIASGINAERARAGLQPLSWRRDLDWLPTGTAERLLEPGAVFEHSDHWSSDLMAASGCYGGSEVLAGRGGSEPDPTTDGRAAVEQWMHSDAHRSLIMSPRRTAMAIGVAYGSSDLSGTPGVETVWVVNLVGDCPSTTPAPAPTPTSPPTYNPGPTEGWGGPSTSPSPEPTPKRLVIKRGARKVRH